MTRWPCWTTSRSTSSMTTPRPTADLVSSLTSVPDAPELPSWLPDEATLNRLAGEFFAALPGTLPTDAGVLEPVRAAPAPGVSGGRVEQAPRVDVPASASDVPQAPGSGGGLAPGGVAPVTAGDPTGVPTGDVPGLAVTDPVAAAGVSPSRAFPDATEASPSEFTAFCGPISPPESPLPGVGGLQLAPPGELTPPLHGLIAPLPGAGAPGLPASDQAVTGGGLPIPSVPIPLVPIPLVPI